MPRLNGYDYKQNGLYFITVCTKERQNILSFIDKNQDLESVLIKLTPIGEIVKKHFEILEERFNNVKVVNYVIMPNHIHLIILLNEENKMNMYGVSSIVGTFKSLVTKECRERFQVNQIFQSSFYDHIIRSEKDYWKIYEYIEKNPANWIYDRYYFDGTIKT